MFLVAFGLKSFKIAFPRPEKQSIVSNIQVTFKMSEYLKIFLDVFYQLILDNQKSCDFINLFSNWCHVSGDWGGLKWLVRWP